MAPIFRLALSLATAAVLAACAGTPAGPSAVATLSPTAGNATAGSVRFVQSGSKVLVSGEVRGLKPNSEHGFHVHEKGDCSAPDAASAGAHFNPSGMPHGGPNSLRRHSGDFGNLSADDWGHARADFIDPYLTFDGPSSIVGRAVIVHADRDDMISQPAGIAGARIACGVIRKQ